MVPTRFAWSVVATALLGVTACLSQRPQPLQVTWLANEGVLLSVGAKQVLIDAFIPEPYSIYTALPPATAAQMLAGEAPFDDIELALASHRHRDHFEPEFARRYLEANKQTRFMSSPQVTAALADHERVETIWPDRDRTMRLSRNGIDVEFFRLSHGTGRFASIQNLGHLIEIDGYRIVHIGDAAMDAANFAPFALAHRDIDVALVPYWYFASDGGRRLVAEHLPARLTIAVHLPRPGEDDANLEAASAAGAEIPKAALQSWRLQRR